MRRNVQIFSFGGEEVAGFFQHGGVSVATVVGWINEVCCIPIEWALYPCEILDKCRVSGPALDSLSENELQPGSYVILIPSPGITPISVSLTTETPHTRPFSMDTASSSNFSDRVRARDRRCCMTGDLVYDDDFVGFDVVHIFPPSETDNAILPGQEVDSVQQAFLCCSTEHAMFNDYSIGVNPDDNYRIYDFVDRGSRRSPHGRIFYRNLNEPEYYLPSPGLLRDHFRQCILRHVKGTGKVDHSETRMPNIDLGQKSVNLMSGNWSVTQEMHQLGAELKARLWETTVQRQMNEVFSN